MSAQRTDGLETCFVGVNRQIRSILEACLEGRELEWLEAMQLSEARGRDLQALCWVADEMRARQVGEVVSYVVNRNINFTNVCVKTCRFCAFSRDVRSEEGYFLSIEEVVRRSVQAWELGATEVCLQAGLAPTADARLYIELVRAVKEAVPDMHIHAFSPEEVKFGASLARLSVQEYLQALLEAGLGSLPGTSAEILDDSVRQRIAPGRITTAEWIHVIRSAHDLGIPTTATMMFGHLETAEHRVRHLDLLRALQRETGGFTEFVPLSFVHHEAPLFLKGQTHGVLPGPTGDDVLRLYAIARLMLGADIPNLQASWVKEGLPQAQWLLSCGVNDLGGTLINESISTAAGAAHGQRVTPATLRRLIRDAGRIPAQRNTRYDQLRQFPLEVAPGEEPPEPLDLIDDPEALFGSYQALTQDAGLRYRFEKPSRKAALETSHTGLTGHTQEESTCV